MGRWLERVGAVIFFLALANFLVFVIIAVSIGGEAISGKVEGGRYYLWYRGDYTEVSRSVWNYSRMHTISVFITHSLGILLGGGLMSYAKRIEKRPKARRTS
jgi:hypothetical protein